MSVIGNIVAQLAMQEYISKWYFYYILASEEKGKYLYPKIESLRLLILNELHRSIRGSI